jgi:hypothetical protein
MSTLAGGTTANGWRADPRFGAGGWTRGEHEVAGEDPDFVALSWSSHSTLHRR